tara:strand:+ start:355 stop:492 length:138 start_codon:yes stop_codon:yes gene_type:complete
MKELRLIQYWDMDSLINKGKGMIEIGKIHKIYEKKIKVKSRKIII